MPRIRLKHRSPEFAETPRDSKPAAVPCAMPGCTRDGAFRAPRDRSLREYYNFCLDHVQEYNKSWDFFAGMSPDQMLDHMTRSLYGDRPTWRYDIEGRIDDILRRRIHDLREGADEDDPSRRPARPVGPVSPEYEAMVTLGLEPPFTLADIKARYRALVRLHHPDRNGGSRQSEDLLKAINTAYALLMAASGADRLP